MKDLVNVERFDDDMHVTFYIEADSSFKILLIKDMLLRAIKKVKTKAKFDYESFKEDLYHCNVM